MTSLRHRRLSLASRAAIAGPNAEAGHAEEVSYAHDGLSMLFPQFL